MRPRGSIWHWWRALAVNLFRGSRRDRELRADIDSYVTLLTDEKIAAGLPPDDARRAARREFGSVDAVTEDTRRVRAGALLAECARDARYAGRMMRRDLGFSLVAILTLALGIGANTATFSVINTVLLHPLPYSDPDRLVLVWERNTSIGKSRDPVSPPNYLDWRSHNSAFDDLGAYRFRSFALGNVPDPEQLRALSLSTSVFHVLRANAEVGRVFTEDEARRPEPVVVLSHPFWQRRFGGDQRVVGRSLTLNGASFTIVGVMPPRFAFPDGDPVDLYTPLVFASNELEGRRSHTLAVIGRLKDGVTVDAAHGDLGAIARRITADDATSNPEVTMAVAHDVLVEDVRLALIILLGTAGCVLLIACANVASLFLVRASSRRRELAMRAALGAGRGRLVRQLLTESVALALAGGAAGTLVAWWLIETLHRFQPPNLPRVDEVSIDTTVLLFVTVAALGTGLACGVIPATQAVRARLNDATKSTSDAARSRTRARSALVVAEVAASLMLMAAAGLMLRSLVTMQDLNLGFRPDNVMTAQLLLPVARYPIDSSQYQALDPGTGPVRDAKPFVFFAELEERLKAAAGIESFGAVSALPLNPVGTDFDLPVVIAGKPRPPAGQEPQADFRVATIGYFRTMQIPLLRGREFNEFDGPDSASVAIINDTLARQLFAGEDPLGQQLVLYGRSRQIVGVVGSVRHHGFTGEPRPEMILPYRQFQFGGMTIAVRSRLERTVLATALTQAVRAIDSQLPVSRLRTMDEFLSDSVTQPRFTTLLLGVFAAVALVLALVGVYGVTSYAVNQRAREIAVRMALGGQRHEVVWLAARQSLAYAAIGIIIGGVGAVPATRLMTGLLFGVTATDPLTFISAAGALGVTALTAGYIPALRAARVAPATALRAE
ncbi:MAG: ADOP family duplicated permease [Acidobacteriota bacterium]